MKHLLLGTLLGMATALASLGADSSRHVVIITLDGCTPALFEDEYAQNLRWLWNRGCYTWRAQTVMPSVTMVAHASLLTGLLPARHGVASNAFQADAEGGLKVPTLLELAKKAGLQTAFIASKGKMRHLDKPGTADCSAYPHSELEELGYDPKKPDTPPRAPFDTVKAVRRCFGAVTPNVCFIHFSQPDLTGHKDGWDSEEFTYALRQVDRKLGELLSDWRRTGFLDSNTMIIVTADHGGHEKTHGTDDPRDMTIPWIVWGPGVRKNHALQTPVRIDDTAATAAYFLKLRIPKDWDGRVIAEIFR
jgi:predicted AlkP superfamily pyrophosphatase or phosphodiesterase